MASGLEQPAGVQAVSTQGSGAKAPSEEERSRERFVRETAEHEMTVRRDDGLYRHLRFQRPGSWSYGFDIVTWPGYLAIVGDCGDYVFSRVTDMFEFFAPSGARGGFEDARWGINPGYWSEKLQAPSPDASRRFSYDKFRRRVAEWLGDYADARGFTSEETAGFQAALAERVLDDSYGEPDENEARRRLHDFEHDGHTVYDSWEWDLREYDFRFLWCCWAIVWGIGQYSSEPGDHE